jgi:hypothetical protein
VVACEVRGKIVGVVVTCEVFGRMVGDVVQLCADITTPEAFLITPPVGGCKPTNHPPG